MIGSIKRVIIVDDSSTMRAMLDFMLSEEPQFKVVGLARDAKDAVALIETTRPHIVMIDLCMPYIDGSALLAMLASHRALCKVVLSTRVNLSDAMQRRLRELGASAIFDKKDIVGDPKGFSADLRAAADGRAQSATGANVAAAADRYPVPCDEVARARAVRALRIANLEPDPRLNILVRHLARLTDYPIATVNVIGSDLLWSKAAVGSSPQMIARGDSVCAHALCRPGVTAIGDLSADPALRRLPAVAGSPQLRTYIGAPIVAKNGARLGVVCVIDTRPRRPTQAEMDIVADVAALVACALETPVARMGRAA